MGNYFYNYFVSDAEIIQKHKKHLTEANGRYFRIFCHKCMDISVYFGCSTTLQQCHSYSCSNYDLGMKSLETKRSICLNHSDDIIAVNGQCDICLTTKRSKNWFNEVKQCRGCKKNVCMKCDQKRLHKTKKCKEPELQTRKSGKVINVICDYYDYDIADFFMPNHYFSDYSDYYGGITSDSSPSPTPSPPPKEQMFDYNLIKSTGTQKKSTRKRMKYKSKYISNWKREHDKKGKIKYNKRSNRRKDVSLIIKSDAMDCI